ncbi:hypothetical protein G2W53_013703 [Senna tora]|uniref:AT hook motif-containing protein n=1 Tax=Senna tora TaxID=362788 RepID=A0A834U2M9_9FABA|nr:hypothetical protein G2W53_013703 [Senna tora]
MKTTLFALQGNKNSEMNQPKHNNNPGGSREVPLKRKRGRPRKYPKVEWKEVAYTPPIAQNPNRIWLSGEHAQAPPGFERTNANQFTQSEVEDLPEVTMVGQSVFGVVEAEFAAGYILNVRIGNYEVFLNGLAVKPGHSIPISIEKEVDGGVPMIPRNVVSSFTVTSTPAQNPQPKERRKHRLNAKRSENLTVKNGSPSVSQFPTGAVGYSNLATFQGKNASSLAEQTTPSLTRGKVVPTVLPPSNLSNAVPINNGPQPHVLTQASLGNAPGVTKEIPADGNQTPSVTHPRARGKLRPIVLPPGDSTNWVPVNNQQPQVLSQASLGSVAGAVKETPADGNHAPSSTRPIARGKLVPLVPPTGNSSHVLPVNNQPPQAMTTQAPLGDQGKLVPVVHTLGKSLTLVQSINQPRVMTRAYLGSVTKQTPEVGNEVASLKTQPSQKTLPRGGQNEDAGHDQSLSDELTNEEASSMRLPNMPFEMLLSAVLRRLPYPMGSGVTETDDSKSGGYIQVQTGTKKYSACFTKPFEIRDISEMSAPLQDNPKADPRT